MTSFSITINAKNCVFPKPQMTHQQQRQRPQMYTHQQQRQRLDARCQIYSRIKNKGFPPPDEKEKVKSNPLGSKNIKAAQISQERESKKHHTSKKSQRI